MNREIKFRQYVWESGKNKPGRMIEWDELKEEAEESLVDIFTTEFSNASPPMQFTGLRDKNGVEIYEGDIVDNSYINPIIKKMIVRHYVVEWESGLYRMKYIGNSPGEYRYLFMIYNDIEVIGNIHDNPGLLP